MIPTFTLGGIGRRRSAGSGGGGSDPYFANVSALLHMDGSDGSTTFTDVIGGTWTANGSAQIDTAQSKFGGASGLFDGDGDYLAGPNTTAFDINGSPMRLFTLEAQFRSATTAQYQVIFQRGGGVAAWNNSTGHEYGLYANITDGKVKFEWENSSSTTPHSPGVLTSTTNVCDSAWHHIAVTFDGTTLRLCIDGTVEASTTSSVNVFKGASVDKTRIGTTVDGGANLGVNGHVDEVRLTVDVARYTANFTPPSAAFPDS